VLAKSVFIPNGMNKTKIGRSTGVLRRLEIEPRNFILSVGRLTPEKGFEYLVEAVNKLDEVEHLVIAGASDHDNSYFKELKQLDWNDKVIFTGFTQGEDLRQLYSHARLYVLSSVNEGFPLVLLEAMSYQLPLVVTDIPASHLIKLPEDNYVEVANSDALAEGIKNALTKDFELQHYDLREYNWDSIAKQTLDVYKQVLK
jgi:glycosyltransferase involved in cell wall biosynthesis